MGEWSLHVCGGGGEEEKQRDRGVGRVVSGVSLYGGWEEEEKEKDSRVGRVGEWSVLVARVGGRRKSKR